MILAKLAIDNYKQFRGHHEFEIPTEATIGVIGANGVGKTTLFEAIEWCLYSPSSFATKDIRPRGHGGLTKVSVVLDAGQGNGQYIVERELKRNSATAIVFELDDNGDEQVLVQGPRQVSTYVATKLIGLSHAAFAATFFTRQKELHFFGNLGDTNRRREVGKLLGLETIRIAQQLIADDRKRAQGEADVLQRQYEEQCAGRDFADELIAAAGRIAQREADAVAAALAASRLGEFLASAEAAQRTLQHTKDQDAALGQQIIQVTGELESSKQRLLSIMDELSRLDTREAQRAELVPVADTLEAVKVEMSELESQRSAFFRKRELFVGLRELQRRRLDSINSIRSTVHEIHVVSQIDGWRWDAHDDDQPAPAIERLIAVVERLDLTSVETRESALIRCRDLAQELARSIEVLDRYKTRRQALDTQEREMLEIGDPANEIDSLDRERATIHEQNAVVGARRTTLESQRDQSRQLIANLDRADFGDRCPTCARPFSEHDADFVIETLRDQVIATTTELDDTINRTEALRERSEFLSERRTELGKRVDQLIEVRSSIRASVSHLGDQEEVVSQHQATLHEALGTASVDAPPIAETLREANRLVDQYRLMKSTRTPLVAVGERLLEIDTERTRAEMKLREIGEVAFDEASHRQTVLRQQAASRAQTTIEQIDQDLVRRPRLTQERDQVHYRISDLGSREQDLRRQRIELGFNPTGLSQSIESVDAARLDERAAVQAHHAAQTALRDADHGQTTLKADLARVNQLAARGDARRRDHDLLEQMYREFTEFERYAAGRLTPILGDLTSDLVREITDGKYDRVEFDGNFGIQVFDGDEERFPLDGFSGGERDAISLSARLALSRMIASQASNPPGFLVLDEVFGSLDRDRRTRLLDLLGTLSGSFEDFRQLFIISHVDDVRTSAVFDEVWLIEETADGSSKMSVLTAGEDIGEL